jgi:hypothetical protein
VKRAIWIVVAAAGWIVPLGGCEADERGQAREDAASDFQAAHEHLANAAGGFINDEAFDGSQQALMTYLAQGARRPEADAPPPAATSLGRYQQRELELAVDKLKPLLDAGTVSQQTAAALALGDAHAMLARMHARRAITAWANESVLTTEMIDTLTAVRRWHTTAQAGRKADQEQKLAQANTRLRQIEQVQAEHDEKIARLDRTIDELNEKKNAAEGRRQENADKAIDRMRRSTESTGKARFDLATEAAQFSRIADEAGAQVDRLETDLDLNQARLRVAKLEQAQIKTDLDSIKETITDLNRRKQSLGGSARQAQAKATEQANTLLDALNERARQHESLIVDQFDAAIDRLTRAIAALEAVAGRARGQDADALESNHATRLAELGQLLHQAAQIDAGYAEAMGLMAKQTAQGAPQQQAEAITKMAQAAQQRHEQTASRAREALLKAADALEQADGGPVERRIPILKYRRTVLRALALLTDDASFERQAQAVDAELQSIEPDN